MNRKIFITFTIFSLIIFTAFSYCFAATNMGDNAKNAVMDAGNSIGNVATGAKNAISNGARDLTNGSSTLGTNTANTTKNVATDIGVTSTNTGSTLSNYGTDYTATRTATNTNFLGMSTTAWTWLILGIVGIVIVALVWYYGAQYEHKDYDNNN